MEIQHPANIYQRRQWQPTPVLLPGKSHGQRSLVGCSPWGHEELDPRLSDFTFTFHFRALEKEMATHSSVLAWRIPGMAEPGGLPSTGSHRTRLMRLSSSSSSSSEHIVLMCFQWTLAYTSSFDHHIKRKIVCRFYLQAKMTLSGSNFSSLLAFVKPVS